MHEDPVSASYPDSLAEASDRLSQDFSAHQKWNALLTTDPAIVGGRNVSEEVRLLSLSLPYFSNMVYFNLQYTLSTIN